MIPESHKAELNRCPKCGFVAINRECPCEVNVSRLQMALRGEFLMDKDEVKHIEIEKENENDNN